MNSILLTGRLTRDPECRNGNGTSVCRYTLAVDRRFKRDGQPDADFFNCTAFGKSAEFAEKYFRQGMRVNVRGSMQSDNYTKQDGTKVYGWQVIVDEQEFGESKRESTQAPAAEPGYVEVPDGVEEDLPFI